MKKGWIQIILLMCVAALGVAPAVQADSYTNELPIDIWDVSGFYAEDLGDGIVMDYYLDQDGKGKLTGFGSAEFHGWSEGIYLDMYMDFIVKGKIKSNKGVYYMTETMSIKGLAEAPDYGESIKFRATVKTKAQIDTENGYLSGMVTVSMMGFKITESFYEPIDDPDMDGSVIIIVEVNPDEKDKLVGDAEIELSNGRIVYCEAKAKVNKRDGSLKIQVNGVKEDLDSKGSKVHLYLDVTDMLQKVKGKVCGQSMKWDLEEK